MSQVLSFRDWYSEGVVAGSRQIHRSVVPEAHRIVDAGPVHLINMTPPAGAVVDPPVPEYAVHLVLNTPPLLQVGFNRPPRWLVMSPGVLLVAPPDTAGDFIADGPSHLLTMTIPTARVDDFTEDSGARIDIRHEEAFRDPQIARRLVRLWHALADDAPASRLLADQVMRGVLEALARRTDTPVAARHARERLSAPTVRRLRDFVESRLADDMDVPMLAVRRGAEPGALRPRLHRDARDDAVRLRDDPAAGARPRAAGAHRSFGAGHLARRRLQDAQPLHRAIPPRVRRDAARDPARCAPAGRTPASIASLTERRDGGANNSQFQDSRAPHASRTLTA